jgi:hypothetical protein
MAGMDGRLMKRVIELWEPESFAAEFEDDLPLLIESEVGASERTLAADNAAVRSRVGDMLGGFPHGPVSITFERAMRVLGLYVEEKFAWHASNDILATRLMELCFHEDFRAHNDGVYQYKDGHWPRSHCPADAHVERRRAVACLVHVSHSRRNPLYPGWSHVCSGQSCEVGFTRVPVACD